MKMIKYQALFVGYIALQIEGLFGRAAPDGVKLITTSDIQRWLLVTPQHARRVMDCAETDGILDVERVPYRGNIEAKKARVTHAYRNEIERTATKDSVNQYMLDIVFTGISERIHRQRLAAIHKLAMES